MDVPPLHTFLRPILTVASVLYTGETGDIDRQSHTFFIFNLKHFLVSYYKYGTLVDQLRNNRIVFWAPFKRTYHP